MNKKLLSAAIGAALVATPLVAAPLAASAQPWGGHYRHYDRHDRGDAAAAGVAGLIIGSALAGRPAYGYAAPRYAYGYGPGYYRAYPRCYWTSQPVYDRWGYAHYRDVRVCR